ncbi:NAD(P)/FAD-dependent oxidoreductase [Robbsia sp. Bb-Pol-6]|uniref:Ferredoxin--NADP reductase n=1 Tax=Robbsia betulipollinis TaxID=2981849 RepID=A0ABT3ZMP9_9BURK|nr:NAD(P)/FAD-dependent oxidoreductase [Robbsia betulipollinis]MCY0387821.1 NAD(P)/FAD-dependent oxidoreductase [Robbsia betulipollinis]
MTIQTDDLLQHDVAPAADDARPLRTDVLIIGAGPVGLFAAFQAGVLGLSCALVEALDEPGGQCIELYPDKPIFDIPALPVCTARELVERLLEQARPFGAPIHLGQRAQTLTRGADGRFTVRTDTGTVFDAASVLIAGGNGAFMPQRLAVERAGALEGHSVHYAVRQVEALRGQRVAIAGGGDSALDWALALRDVAASVTLIHRRDTFRAAPATVEALRGAVARGEIALEVGVIDAVETLPGAHASALAALQVKRRDGEVRLPADQLIVLYGLVASLGPIAEWGLALAGGRAEVDTSSYQTSSPGVFAVGDIATYPNKQKLILSGFHEAALALRAAYRLAKPDQTRTHIHSSYDPRLAATVLGTDMQDGGATRAPGR